MVGLGVLVDGAIRLREPDAVDDAAVVELVRNDDIALSRELRDEARVRGVAGLEDERRFGALERGEPPPELRVEIHRPCDRPYPAPACPVGSARRLARRPQG